MHSGSLIETRKPLSTRLPEKTARGDPPWRAMPGRPAPVQDLAPNSRQLVASSRPGQNRILDAGFAGSHETDSSLQAARNNLLASSAVDARQQRCAAESGLGAALLPSSSNGGGQTWRIDDAIAFVVPLIERCCPTGNCQEALLAHSFCCNLG